jgi:hypothetical protein
MHSLVLTIGKMISIVKTVIKHLSYLPKLFTTFHENKLLSQFIRAHLQSAMSQSQDLLEFPEQRHLFFSDASRNPGPSQGDLLSHTV